MDSQTPGPNPTRAQLQGSLQALHAQLASTPRMDARARGLLQEQLTDVQRRLQRTDDSQQTSVTDPAMPAERPSQRLESLALEFEAEHPRLTDSLRQFIELCSQAGL